MSFMSGFAANVTALNTVFTVDLYQGYIRKGASEQHYLQVGRWVTVGGILLSTIVALAAADMNHLIGLLGLLFSLLNAPLLATLLLGMFWKRATGHGAFAGLLSGVVVAMLHYGLTLPIEAQRGIQGGWIARSHLLFLNQPICHLSRELGDEAVPRVSTRRPCALAHAQAAKCSAVAMEEA
jgi:SSS family solute:Na+ symporter